MSHIDLGLLQTEINRLMTPLVQGGKLTADEANQLLLTGKYLAELGPRRLAGEDVDAQAKIVWATVLSIAEKKNYDLQLLFKAMLMDAMQTVATVGLKGLLAVLV